MNQNSDVRSIEFDNCTIVRSIEFDNDSSSFFDNFLRNPVFKSPFIPCSVHVIPYKTVQKAVLRCAIFTKLRNYPCVLTKIIAETFIFECSESNSNWNVRNI